MALCLVCDHFLEVRLALVVPQKPTQNVPSQEWCRGRTASVKIDRHLSISSSACRWFSPPAGTSLTRHSRSSQSVHGTSCAPTKLSWLVLVLPVKSLVPRGCWQEPKSSKQSSVVLDQPERCSSLKVFQRTPSLVCVFTLDGGSQAFNLPDSAWPSLTGGAAVAAALCVAPGCSGLSPFRSGDRAALFVSASQWATACLVSSSGGQFSATSTAENLLIALGTSPGSRSLRLGQGLSQAEV